MAYDQPYNLLAIVFERSFLYKSNRYFNEKTEVSWIFAMNN